MKCTLDGRNWGCHLGSQVGRPMMRTIEQHDGKSSGPDAQETIILSLDRLPGLHIWERNKFLPCLCYCLLTNTSFLRKKNHRLSNLGNTLHGKWNGKHFRLIHGVVIVINRKSNGATEISHLYIEMEMGGGSLYLYGMGRGLDNHFNGYTKLSQNF